MGAFAWNPNDFSGGGGSGNVFGPGSSTDNAFARFNGTTGKILQNSLLSMTDAGALTVGSSGGTQTHTVNGRLSVVDNSVEVLRVDESSGLLTMLCGPGFTSAGEFWMYMNRTDSMFKIIAGSTDTGDSGIWLYGDTHASFAGKFAVKGSSGTETFSVLGNSAATIGVSGLTTPHTVQGPIRYPVNLNTFSGSSGSFAAEHRYRKLTSGSAKTMLGIAPGSDGQVITYINSGGDLTVSNESGSATAANRIITGSGADLTITGDGAVTFIYDTDSSRWRVVAVVN